MSNVLVELSNAMAAAAEKAGASTLLVNARRRMPASGIAFAADLVLTADHVIEQEEGITVVLPDGTEVGAKLAGRDPGSDLAVLRLEKALAKPAESTSVAKIGELVLALGRPSAEGIEVSLGVISAVGGPVRTPGGSIDKFIRTDTTPFPGFSGGPLVDAEGRVVGVNTSGFGRGVGADHPGGLRLEGGRPTGQDRLGQARLPGHPQPGRGDRRSCAQKALKREQATGLLVVSVEEDSPAEAGQADGRGYPGGHRRPARAGPRRPLCRLTGEAVDKPLPVEILRGGRPEKVKVKIGARA